MEFDLAVMATMAVSLPVAYGQGVGVAGPRLGPDQGNEFIWKPSPIDWEGS
jgi:hypothetical protein